MAVTYPGPHLRTAPRDKGKATFDARPRAASADVVQHDRRDGMKVFRDRRPLPVSDLAEQSDMFRVARQPGDNAVAGFPASELHIGRQPRQRRHRARHPEHDLVHQGKPPILPGVMVILHRYARPGLRNEQHQFEILGSGLLKDLDRGRTPGWHVRRARHRSGKEHGRVPSVRWLFTGVYKDDGHGWTPTRGARTLVPPVRRSPRHTISMMYGTAALRPTAPRAP